MKKTIARLGIAALLATGAVTPLAATSADAAPVKYKNCTALNKKYPHGVKKASSTKDRYVSGGKTRLRASKARVDAKLYQANVKLDRDKDGLACEK
ncbi:excalibur calcium-binding domain-containing protein [Luteococcus peritonei]|uniref:Excalibur calcium-binding domain-containing protein n=1 Tax=Luteococcus peritonei TaxID=88874 RepID=A0ABW4RXU3_9ACTN